MRKLFLSLFAALLASQAWAEDYFYTGENDCFKCTIIDATNSYVSISAGFGSLSGNLVIDSMPKLAAT